MSHNHFDLHSIKGLTGQEVLARRKRDGFNEMPSAQKRGIFKIIGGVLKEPMFILLVICGTLYFLLGDVEEALMLIGFVFVIIGITVYQEGKTENAIEALRDLSSPRALAIRDGVEHRIPGREVVRDDIIIVREGDRIPADACLIWAMNLKVDESLLTGESVPVRKCAHDSPEECARQPGGDDLPFLYSGGLIVEGQGIARVTAIGGSTEMGRIGKMLKTIVSEETLLQKSMEGLVKKVFIFALAVSFLVLLIYGLFYKEWVKGVLSAVSLAMGLIPEEFPVVLTIFLALGAWRMSKKNVLTRKVAAVETLGAATVLCVDKTGTLTENRMTVKKLYNGTAFHDVFKTDGYVLPEDFHELVEYAILASKKDPFDPMERALNELGVKTLSTTEHIHTDWPLVEEYPLSRQMMALSHVWERTDGGYVVSTKGAPEAISDLCHLTPDERADMMAKTEVMAREGLRVLGVAHARFTKEKLPSSQHDFDFGFVGLIGLADPIRASVPPAVAECYTAGIRVVMITGDYPVTAQDIARQIGLKNSDRVITGKELAAMTDDERIKAVRTVNIFSRIVPEQKLLIVDALKSCGEIVAMTGDGVNDAPALKSAHIGIAMGERGTDVARESADLVLLKDDFSSIVEAVRMGRRIFDNLKKALAYIISVHIPIAGLALIPVVFNWPIILYPAHIVFLELIIDPACSVVFESERAELDIMEAPPRDSRAPLFGKKLLIVSFLQGFFSLVTVIAVFIISLHLKQGEAGARTLTFMTLIVSNLCLILTNRSWSRSILSSFSVLNRSLSIVMIGAAVFLGLTIYVPFLKKLFHFSTMHSIDIIICFCAGIWSVVWFELVKWISKRSGTNILKI